MQTLKCIYASVLILSGIASSGQEIKLTAQQDRWTIQPDGSIQWMINGRLPHNDHIEMGGEKCAMWIQYAVDTSAKPKLSRTMVFPSFRLLPQRTIAHMTYNVEDNDLPRIFINDRLLKSGVYNAAVAPDAPEKVVSITHRGIMQIDSEVRRDSVKIKRIYFPSVDKPIGIEKMVFINGAKRPVKIEMEYLRREARPAAERTTGGPHHFFISTIGEGLKTIQPGDSIEFAIIYQATKGEEQPVNVVVNQEEQKRKSV